MSDQTYDDGPKEDTDDPRHSRLQALLAQLVPANDFNLDGEAESDQESLAAEQCVVEIPGLKKTFLQSAIQTGSKTQELSNGLKEYIENRYNKFQQELLRDLAHISLLGAYPADGLGDRNSSILNEVDFKDEHGHTKAILQMEYAKTWSRWSRDLHAGSIEFLIVNSFLNDIPTASDAFETACKEIDRIDAATLARYFRFGFHTTGTAREPEPSSLVTLFIEAAESTDKVAVYKKMLLIDAIESRTAVTVMRSDRMTDHPGRHGDVYVSELQDAVDAYGPVADRRIELISDGAIFIKPVAGARAFAVQKLSYDPASETMLLSSRTQLPVQIEKSRSEVLRAFLKGDTSQIKSSYPTASEEDEEWTIRLIDGTELITATDPAQPAYRPEPQYTRLVLRGEDNPRITGVLLHGFLESIEEASPLPAENGEPQSWSLILEDGSLLITTSDPESQKFNPTFENTRVLHEIPTSVTCTSIAFLDGMEFEPLGDDTYEIHVPREKLRDFFIGLEIAAIEANGIATYAEEAIPIVKHEGHTWEIRQVNQALDLEDLINSPEQILTAAASLQTQNLASYVKMSSSGDIASISLGDVGRKTDEVLAEVLHQIDPEITAAEIESLTDSLTGKCTTAGEEIQTAVSDYLTAIKNDVLPDYPIERIAVDSMSTDFMVIFDVDSKTGKVTELTPVLVDINFSYGTRGLGQAAFLDSRVVSDNQKRLNKLVDGALEAV